MPNISEVADGIYQIEIDEAKTSGTAEPLRCSTVYLIVADGQTALIETGPAVVAPVVLGTIRRLGHDPSRLSYILLTHIHLDHAGGAGTLAHQCPQLQVLVHQRGARHLVEPSRLIEGTRQAFGERFEDEYGPIVPVPEGQVRAVDDGEVIPLGERELRIIYAPGHAPHHMCIYDTKSQGIFSGDALGTPPIESNIVLTVAGFDLDSALESIDKLSQLNPKVVFFSHGGVSRETARLMQSLRANTKAYGDIILGALKAGEGKEEMARRLGAYHSKLIPGEYHLEEHRFEHIIPWYVAHFKRKGVA